MLPSKATIATIVLALVALFQNTLHAQSSIGRNSQLGAKAALQQGALEAVRDTDVATAEIGVVQHLYVKLGDHVNEGDVIGQLHSELQHNQLNEAELDAASQGLLEGALREVEFNQRKFDETKQLVSEGKASPRELERHHLDLGMAKAKVIVQEDAKRISLARLDRAKTALAERTIHAPHDGIVVEIFRGVGEYIAGNSPAMVRIVDNSQLRARFFLDEGTAEQLRARKEVEVRLANNHVVVAQIEFIAPVANAEGHVVEMTVLLNNKDGNIRSSFIELVQP